MHPLLTIWHWFQEVLGMNIGIPGHTPRWYNFWSGFGSDLGEAALLVSLYHLFAMTRCHEGGDGFRGCPRHGKYEFTDNSTGITHKLCSKHHPAAPKRLSHLDIIKIHKRNRADTYER